MSRYSCEVRRGKAQESRGLSLSTRKQRRLQSRANQKIGHNLTGGLALKLIFKIFVV